LAFEQFTIGEKGKPTSPPEVIVPREVWLYNLVLIIKILLNLF
jgi:hypothetical protein